VSTPVLRAASEADAEGIRQLIAATFPDNIKSDARVLTWQYWRNPFGPAISWVYDHDGRIIAHHSVIPYPAMLDGHRGLIGKSTDLAIHPDYRGRGLFPSLAIALSRDAGRAGMPATMAYPNENSIRGVIKAGWQEIGVLRTHLLPLDPGWVTDRLRVPLVVASGALKLSRRSRPRLAICANEVDSPPADADSLWRVVGARVRYGVIRDQAWLTWRYVQRPIPGAYRYYEARHGGELLGLAVTTTRRQHGAEVTFLLELLAVTAEAGRALVNLMAGTAGTAALVLATLTGTATSRLARHSGLWLLPGALEPKPLPFWIVDNAGNWPRLARNQWSLGWGDLDHI